MPKTTQPPSIPLTPEEIKELREKVLAADKQIKEILAESKKTKKV